MAPSHENICNFCIKTILSSGERSGVHHISNREHDSSARQGCVICVTLARDFAADIRHAAPLEWPLYRWNLQNGTRLREGRDMKYLIFRAIAPIHHAGSTIHLRDRRFNLHREEDQLFCAASTLGPSTDAPQTWTRIDSWLQACNEDNHPNCKQTPLTVQDLPTRLLDLTGIDIDNPSGRIKLVETRTWKTPARYVTLSHSWGKDTSFYKVTDHEKVFMMNEGIPLTHPGVSKNFQDAITVAKRLHVDYIWIDFMCIIQQNGEDFKKEALLMHKNYRNAYCNIGATASRHPSNGLFRARSPDECHSFGKIAVLEDETSRRMLGNSTWLIVPADIWEEILLQNPLYERAWVFQERALCARMIHYAAQEVYFECATISACETFPGGIPQGSDRMAVSSRQWRQWLHKLSDHDSPSASNLVGESLDEFWQTVIRIYTGCQLTNPVDKVTAISGVAELVSRGLKEDIGRGLWSERLEEQLAWRVADCRKADGTPSCRLQNQEPTWSWASVDGIINLQKSRLVEDREYNVVGHDGKPIRFEIRESASAPALPHTFSVELHEPPQTSLTVSASAASLSKDRHNSIIRVRGHLRKGAVVRPRDTEQWMLQVSDMPSAVADNFAQNHTVFPDVEIATDSQDCSFMVVAYSRSSEIRNSEYVYGIEEEDSPAKFHGIGLILQDTGDRYFERSGSFDFINLSEEELFALVHVADPRENSSVNASCNANRGIDDGQAEDIFLI